MNNTIGASYEGFGTTFLVMLDAVANRQGRAQFWPTQPPPLPLFTKPREATRRFTQSVAAFMTMTTPESHGIVQSLREKRGPYIEIMSDQHSQVLEPE